MKSDELKSLLGLKTANIKFYQQEQLIKSKYKDENYSDDEIKRLKQVVVFDRLGLSISDIKDILNQAKPLSCIIESYLNDTISARETTEDLIAELSNRKKKDADDIIKECDSAIKIFKLILQNNDNIETFDADYYLEAIETEVQNGTSFSPLTTWLSSVKGNFENGLLGKTADFIDYIERDKKNAVKALIGIIATILALSLIRGIIGVIWHNSFIESFFGMFIVLILVLALLVPVFLLNQYGHEKAANIYWKIIMGIVIASAVLFLIFLAALAIMALKNQFTGA